MVGAALGRLWDTHPKLAFPLHVLSCGLIGLGAAVLLVQRSSLLMGTFAAIIFLVDAASIIIFTIDAAQRGWSPEVVNEPRQTPSPKAAWRAAKPLERLTWTLFAIAFLSGLVLMASRSMAGVVLFFISVPLALLAMWAGRQRPPN
jgi:hypothetical protein